MDFRPGYYIDLQPFLRSVKKRAYGPLDANGLPMVNYGGRVGLRYNPTIIALYTLAIFQGYVQGGSADKTLFATFMKGVDSLAQRGVTVGGKTYWFIDFYWHNPRAHWISGMTQGLCVSALVRAFLKTGNSHHLELAQRAARVLSEPIERGGPLMADESGTWIEEYPKIPVHILNGFIYAIFGLLDGTQFFESGDSRVVLKACISTLERNLHRYDLGYWSRYDLQSKFPCSPKYHLLHINQVEAMYGITRQPVFQEFATRWRRFDSSRPNKLVMQALYLGMSSMSFLRSFSEASASMTQYLRKEM